MITKIQNVMFVKSKSGSTSTRISIANPIMKGMECSKDERKVLATFNGSAILIQKSDNSAIINDNNARELNLTFFVRSGHYSAARLILPSTWIKAIGVTPENRTVTVQFDEDSKILTIRKDVE